MCIRDRLYAGAADIQASAQDAEPAAHHHVSPADGEIVGAGEGVPLLITQSCTRCGQTRKPTTKDDEEAHRRFDGFTVNMRVARNVAAETVLTRLPEIPSEIRRSLPAGGRRLLAFSDSRSDSASLGATLAAQHERLLFRARLARAVGTYNPAIAARWSKKLADARKRINSASLSKCGAAVLINHWASH